MHLSMRGIVKSFGANNVLKNVDFSLQGGEVMALLGENGAGKSTLMNILGGIIPYDEGEILVDGRRVSFQTPSQSLQAGIAFIHQELNLINDLPVYENMFIGRELRGRFGFLDREAMKKATADMLGKIGMDIRPETMVSELDASYKQIAEITRALMMNASLIIMDEPTTSLTDSEIERVFQIIETLKKQNVAVIFISHKLREVIRICDRYSVLRDGKMVASGLVSETTTDQLAEFMVGHKVRTGKPEHTTAYGDERLRLEKLTLEPYFRNVDLTVRAGEVVGVTGLLGDGRSELFRSVFGDLNGYEGTIRLNGQKVHIHSTRQALKLGLGYLPRNRKENGIVKDMSILENGSLVTLQAITKLGLIRKSRQLSEFMKQKADLRIKMGKPQELIGSLSGGNQQKVVLAKWLSAHPQVLILDNPTQGVDVGSKEEIYDIILELAEKGVAVVVLSNEAAEIIRVCDRTLVMCHGSTAGEIRGEEMNEQNIMRLATGLGRKEEAQ